MLHIQEHSRHIPLAQPPQNTPKTLRPLHNGPTPARRHSEIGPNKKPRQIPLPGLRIDICRQCKGLRG